MNRIHLPDNVVDAVHRRWPDLGPAWSARVVDELDDVCRTVSATTRRVLPARYGLVVSVATPDGPLVLRASADPDGWAQLTVSRTLAELGAGPAIHDWRATSTGSWTIMDQVVPGTTFYDARLTPHRIAGLAATLAAMVGRRPPEGLSRIGDWLSDRLTTCARNDLAPGLHEAPDGERAKAAAILAELLATGHDGLCHGDTSLGNILVGPDHRIMLVDTRGMSGEVAFDVAVVAIKAEVNGAPLDVDGLARRVGVDPERVRAWVSVAIAARV